MARVVLIIAAVVEFIFRGLPAFFGSQPVANLFGLAYNPECLVYTHPFGALMLVFGVMFFIASKDPGKYRFVLDMGILRYALALVSYFVTLGTAGSLVAFWWVHLVVDVILLVLFVLSRSKVVAA